jgi:hypothetical protein
MTLELATTEELIAELLGRTTFAGLILYSPEAHKFNGQVHEGFKLLTPANEEDTIRLLEAAIEIVKQQSQ